jgi:hypothetical protein
MWHQPKYRDRSAERAVHTFGVSLSPTTGRWSSFNEETSTILSEHLTEAQAHAACRRYEVAAYRRLSARSPLSDLAHRAV